MTQRLTPEVCLALGHLRSIMSAVHVFIVLKSEIYTISFMINFELLRRLKTSYGWKSNATQP